MDLSSPLRSLIPSLDSAVLEVLAGTESGLGVSQIARLAQRGSRPGLALALERLVEHGLVVADAANRGSLFRLNREHVLADAVLTAYRARATVLERLGDAVGALTPRPLHASVFGSFARREAGPESDIDLLVVVATEDMLDEAWHTQLRVVCDQVLAWTGNRMEFLVFTEDELTRVVQAGEPIVGSWRADSVTVMGAPIEALLRRP